MTKNWFRSIINRLTEPKFRITSQNWICSTSKCSRQQKMPLSLEWMYDSYGTTHMICAISYSQMKATKSPKLLWILYLNVTRFAEIMAHNIVKSNVQEKSFSLFSKVKMAKWKKTGSKGSRKSWLETFLNLRSDYRK